MVVTCRRAFVELALSFSLIVCGASVSAAIEADDRLCKCLQAVNAISQRQHNLPTGSNCRDNRRRLAEMSKIGDEIRRLRRRICRPQAISGGELSLDQAEKLVASWESNGASLASLLKTERKLHAITCR